MTAIASPAAASAHAAHAVLAAARAAGRAALLEHEVYALFAAAGFAVPRHALWSGAPALGPGEDLPEAVRALAAALGPGAEVVLKIVSPDLLHKSDVGGVAFARADSDAIHAAAARLWAEVGRRAPAATRLGVLAVEKVTSATVGPAAEALVALKQDPAFGTVVVFGLGGLLTEWYGRVASGGSTVVLSPGDVRAGLAQAMRDRPALALLLAPSRLGPAPLDLDETAARLEALAAIGRAHAPDTPDGPESPAAPAAPAAPITLDELEANPILLAADGRWLVVDGKGRTSSTRTPAPRPVPAAGLTALLSPRSAVVLGASATASNPGRVILRNLQRAECIPPGAVRAVHPRADAIDGVPCVPSVEALAPSLGGPVDLAVVSVPADAAADAVRSLAAAGARAIQLIPGGFGESGHPERERAVTGALAAARAHAGADGHGGGPVLIGPNCLGVVVRGGYNTFFIPTTKLPFHPARAGDGLAVISQSGAWLVSLSSRLDGVVQPRAVVSIGNQLDVTAADLLDHFAADPAVRVIACYLEGFRPLDGARFARRARALSAEGRRVLVYKAGRTEAGAAAARSHTASLAGDFAVAHDLLAAAGALIAADLDELGDAIKVHALLADRIPSLSVSSVVSPVVSPIVSRTPSPAPAPTPTGAAPAPRVAIVSNAGFECSVVADHLGPLGRLVPATLAEPTRRRLAAALPAMAHADNPVDATPVADTRAFAAAVEAVLADDGVDCAILSPLPATPALDVLPPDPFGAHDENLYAPGSLGHALVAAFRATRKPVVACVDAGALYDPLVALLERAGLPTFRRIDRAARALGHLLGPRPPGTR